MNIEAFKARLAQIKSQLEANTEVAPVSVREILRWAGAERRGYLVSYRIRTALSEEGLVTNPRFDIIHIDSSVQFSVATTAPAQAPTDPAASAVEVAQTGAPLPIPANEEASTATQYVVGATDEPAFRVSRLLAASHPPVRIAPTATLMEAVTIMMRHGYSQLPVMTTDREVKGIVTWASIAVQLQVANEKPTIVQQCMQSHVEVPDSESLFTVVGKIVEHSYVLVRSADRTISGIVTATDLSLQFRQLSEPFLLLGEIENHLRSLIDGRFTQEELQEAKNPEDADRTIGSVADLTLGEIVRLLGSDANWNKIGVPLDRGTIMRDLEGVRSIRNDVMHFDPDGITPDEHALLFKFVQFLHEVRRLRQP